MLSKTEIQKRIEYFSKEIALPGVIKQCKSWSKKYLEDKPKLKKLFPKAIVNGLNHEFFHFFIYEKFLNDPELTLEVNDENPTNMKTIITYPIEYSYPKYYFRFIFIEFIQMFYDLIDRFFDKNWVRIPNVIKIFLKKLTKFSN